MASTGREFGADGNRNRIQTSNMAITLKTITAAIIVVLMPAAALAEGDIAITIHDSNGLTAASAAEHTLDVNLFKEHTHIHLRISNKTDGGLTLWKPNCPQGDHAMWIEFRDPVLAGKVYRSGNVQSYTGGMGIPKVFTLAAKSDLIVNVDLGVWWNLPFEMADGESREMEMRAVYASEAPPDEKARDESQFKAVWVGNTASAWEKVRIVNRTGRKVGQASDDTK